MRCHMKKLLFVTPGKLPVPALKGGAVETLIEMLLTENENEGCFEIDIFTLWDQKMKTIKYHYSKLIPVKSSPLINLLDKLYFLYWEKIKRDWRATFHRNHFRDSLYKKRLKNILLKNEYDDIIVENNMSLLECIYKTIGKEKFSTVCNYHMHSVFIDNPDMIFYLSACKQIITVSDFVRKSMIDDYAEFADVKFAVLLNTIDVSKFDEISLPSLRNKMRLSFNIGEKTFVFLYSGRLSTEKGVKELIAAFETLNCKSAKLIIAGGSYSGDKAISEYEAKLKKHCIENNLNVDFIGFVENNDMIKIYALADVLVIPSIAKEAGSLTAIEGMHLGIPMIVSETGSLPEYLKDYPIYAKPGDDFINNLRVAMEKSLIDNNLKSKFPPKKVQGNSWFFTQFKKIID